MLFTDKDAIQPQHQASAHTLWGYLWLWVHIFMLKCNILRCKGWVIFKHNRHLLFLFWLLLYSFAMVLLSYTLIWPPCYPFTSLKFQSNSMKLFSCVPNIIFIQAPVVKGFEASFLVPFGQCKLLDQKVKIEKSFLTNPTLHSEQTCDMFWKTVVICVHICTDTRHNPLMVSQSKTQTQDSKPFVYSSGTISWHKQKIFCCFSCEDTALQGKMSSVCQLSSWN